MDDPSKHAAGITDDFIRSFERRARFLRLTAGLILLVVILLLGVGAYVFLAAPSIATTDLEAGVGQRQTLESSRGRLREERDYLTETRDRYRAQFEVAQRTLLEVAKVETDLISTQMNLDLVESRIRRYDKGDEVAPGSQFATLEEVEIAIRNQEELAKTLRRYETFHKERRDAQAGSETNLIVASHGVESVSHELETLYRHRIKLQDAERAEKTKTLLGTLIARMIGTESEAPGTQTRLVQTNVTRFGTLVVVFFFIALLQPIFRYNTRLGAYYDARAEALLLYRESGGQDIGTLVSIVTPTLSFEKEPSGVQTQGTDAVTDAIRTAVKGDRM